jgi:hypothetical protein
MSEDAVLVIVAIFFLSFITYLFGGPKNAPPDTSWNREKWIPSDIGKRKAGWIISFIFSPRIHLLQAQVFAAFWGAAHPT